MNKIMKKQYISPETLSYKLRLGSLLNTASITGVVKGDDLTHDIEIGGNAVDGTISDSRRRSLWDDDEQDEFGY